MLKRKKGHQRSGYISASSALPHFLFLPQLTTFLFLKLVSLYGFGGRSLEDRNHNRPTIRKVHPKFHRLPSIVGVLGKHLWASCVCGEHPVWATAT